MMNRLHASMILSALLLAPVAAQAQVFVPTAPPAPIVENQPASPGPNFAWIAGFWSWNGSQYAWTAGRWEQKPPEAQDWEPPRWEHEGQGYRFRQGRWRGRNGGMVQVPTAVAVGTPVGYAPIAQVPPPAQAVVNMAPPPPVVEAQPPSPGPNFTWVAGFWNWNGSQYTWTAGRWEQPPAPAQAWESPRWEREGQGYRFRPGHWHHHEGQGMQPPVVAPPPPPPPPVFVTVAPPRPRVERRPPMPGPGQFWVPGFWTWNGSQHVWNAGHWDTPPTPAARWIPARWTRQGRNWNYTPGIWH